MLDDLDMLSSSFPCQGFSSRGKRKMLDDPRSGLWKVMCSKLKLCASPPEFVFIENSPNMLVVLMVLLLDMFNIGYIDARWMIAGGMQCGARHVRRRAFILFRHKWSRRQGIINADLRTDWAGIAADFASEPTSLQHALCRPLDLPDELARCREMGNSVIVPVVRLATLTLLCG